MSQNDDSKQVRTYTGGCHCKLVRFEIKVPTITMVTDCNCSICTMVGFLHFDVTKEQFTLLQGKESLTDYRFLTKVAQHTFCSACGVKPFYVPRSNPNGYSINVRCLDNFDLKAVKIRPLDGQNWEDNKEHMIIPE